MDRQDGQDEVRVEKADRGAVGKLPGLVYDGFTGFHGSVRDCILYILCIHVYRCSFIHFLDGWALRSHFLVKWLFD